MKTLIVEDDFISRLLLQEILKTYGPAHIAINGREAVEAARMAIEAGEPYDLICMDIMMPEMDGQEALKQIRSLEEEKGNFSRHHDIHRSIVSMNNGLNEIKNLLHSERTKIIMITVLDDEKNINTAVNGLCDSYLVKPIDRFKLLEVLQKLKLVA